MESAVRPSTLVLLCLLAGCGEPCKQVAENGKAVVMRCGETMHVKVGEETVFIGDVVVKTEWISDTRLRITYPMDSRVHSRESKVKGLRVEYEAVSR